MSGHCMEEILCLLESRIVERLEEQRERLTRELQEDVSVKLQELAQGAKEQSRRLARLERNSCQSQMVQSSGKLACFCGHHSDAVPRTAAKVVRKGASPPTCATVPPSTLQWLQPEVPPCATAAAAVCHSATLLNGYVPPSLSVPQGHPPAVCQSASVPAAGTTAAVPMAKHRGGQQLLIGSMGPTGPVGPRSTAGFQQLTGEPLPRVAGSASFFDRAVGSFQAEAPLASHVEYANSSTPEQAPSFQAADSNARSAELMDTCSGSFNTVGTRFEDTRASLQPAAPGHDGHPPSLMLMGL